MLQSTREVNFQLSEADYQTLTMFTEMEETNIAESLKVLLTYWLDNRFTTDDLLDQLEDDIDLSDCYGGS